MGLDHMVAKTITDELDETLLHKWDSAIPLMYGDVVGLRELKNNEADKYIFDFNGLLNSLNVPEKYWYVHMRLNNLKSSTDYNGANRIFLVDMEYLNGIYNSFTNRSYG